MCSLGDVELKIKITAFQFQSSPSQEASLLIDSNTPMERILDVVCGDITFAGCGQCSAELETDENGIYRPCYPCLPHTGVRRYYRSVLTDLYYTCVHTHTHTYTQLSIHTLYLLKPS